MSIVKETRQAIWLHNPENRAFMDAADTAVREFVDFGTTALDTPSAREFFTILSDHLGARPDTVEHRLRELKSEEVLFEGGFTSGGIGFSWVSEFQRNTQSLNRMVFQLVDSTSGESKLVILAFFLSKDFNIERGVRKAQTRGEYVTYAYSPKGLSLQVSTRVGRAPIELTLDRYECPEKFDGYMYIGSAEPKNTDQDGPNSESPQGAIDQLLRMLPGFGTG